MPPSPALASLTALAAHPRAARLRQWLPGTVLAGVIALAATFVSTTHGGPQLLYALFFGVFFNYLSGEPRTQPGLELCARGLLRLAVGLLGARITLQQIQSLGWSTAAIVVSAVLSTLLLGLLAARRLGLSRAQGVLAGGSVGICGASAALALSAVLPRNRDNERFTLMVVVTVTVLSTLAMVLYPLLARALHLPPELAGLFLGATIHDVAQVVGAGYLLGNETGDVATVVKLFRVALLTLVVMGVALAWRRGGAADGAAHSADNVNDTNDADDAHGTAPAQRPSAVPWFLWVFLALVVANTEGWLSAGVQAGLGDLSRALLVMAIAALGTKTSFAQLAQTGWRPLLLILAETVWIAAWVLGWVMLRG